MTFKALGFPMERIYSWMGGKVDGNPQTGHHINLKEANKCLWREQGCVRKISLTAGLTHIRTVPAIQQGVKEQNAAG